MARVPGLLFEAASQMALPSDETVIEAPLTLAGLVEDLHADGRLTDADHTRLARLTIGSVHPLVYLAEQKLLDAVGVVQ